MSFPRPETLLDRLAVRLSMRPAVGDHAVPCSGTTTASGIRILRRLRRSLKASCQEKDTQQENDEEIPLHDFDLDSVKR